MGPTIAVVETTESMTVNAGVDVIIVTVVGGLWSGKDGAEAVNERQDQGGVAAVPCRRRDRRPILPTAHHHRHPHLDPPVRAGVVEDAHLAVVGRGRGLVNLILVLL